MLQAREDEAAQEAEAAKEAEDYLADELKEARAILENEDAESEDENHQDEGEGDDEIAWRRREGVV